MAPAPLLSADGAAKSCSCTPSPQHHLWSLGRLLSLVAIASMLRVQSVLLVCMSVAVVALVVPPLSALIASEQKAKDLNMHPIMHLNMHLNMHPIMHLMPSPWEPPRSAH